MWSGKIEDYILYEDKNIIVCHKPAGLAVQNARIGSADMESALKNYLYKKEPGKMPYLGIGRLSEKRRTYQYVSSCSRRHTRGKKGQAFISGDP